MLRDRTELQHLTRQLDAVGTMSTALRAQRHEFANQLHTIAGFMSIGQHQQAREYLARLAATGPAEVPGGPGRTAPGPLPAGLRRRQGRGGGRTRRDTAHRPGNAGPRPGHRTAGRHHRAGQPDRQRRERRRRRLRGGPLGGSGGAGRTGRRRRARCTSSSRTPATGWRRNGGGRARRRCSPKDSRRRHGRPVPAPGRGWGWHWPGSSRGAAAGTSGSWNPAPPAARAPSSWPRCRGPPPTAAERTSPQDDSLAGKDNDA